MTSTNHALTGAVIALAVKQPALAIPLAFGSHFIVDMIPHYNPNGVKGFNKLGRKFKHRSFWWVFGIDMSLFGLLLITLPFLLITTVTSLTIFLSMLAAASPDFVDGYHFLVGHFRKKTFKPNWFDKFCIAIQHYEKPPGMIVEVGWMLLMCWFISRLSSI